MGFYRLKKFQEDSFCLGILYEGSLILQQASIGFNRFFDRFLEDHRALKKILVEGFWKAYKGFSVRSTMFTECSLRSWTVYKS